MSHFDPYVYIGAELRKCSKNTLEGTSSVETVPTVMENMREATVCALEEECDAAWGRNTLARIACTKPTVESSFGL